MGEIVGTTTTQGFDPAYPGLVYTLQLPDVDKSCYFAARVRATCDLKSLTYVLMPNDHTAGGAGGAPAPELMISVNDEATGMLLDALSHSPHWATTLVVITEDDLSTDVPRGENARRTLQHAAVVRGLQEVATLKPGDASPYSARATISLLPSWRTDHLRVAVFVQEKKSGNMLAAGHAVPVPPAAEKK